jgi:hypothetical protein
MQSGKLMRKPSGGERAWSSFFSLGKITGLTFQLAWLFLYHSFGMIALILSILNPRFSL